MYDIVIIGSGVIGCSIARELSKYNMKICVVEKESDVAAGTSKANSGIVHGGFDAKTDSMKARFNVEGNKMFDSLSKQLDFPFKRNGSLVLCFEKDQICKLEELKDQGEKNGVSGLEIIDKKRLHEMEPNISGNAVAALYAPTGGIVCPYEMTIAMAENAYTNGVEFKFENEVKTIKKCNNEYIVITDKCEIKTKLVINAAGVYADEINNMVSERKAKIIPRKGEYCLFDKAVGEMVKSTIFQLPTKMGKGILVTPTVDGNLLIGPTAYDIDDKSNVDTTRNGIKEVINKASLSVGNIPQRQMITTFSGLRAHEDSDDFIIGEAEDAKGFINVMGIESPGLSSAPAIAKYVEQLVVEQLEPEKNPNFNPNRKGIVKFRELNNEERKKLIAQRSEYGKIICRCEVVTEGEIIDSIRRPLGARTLDGVKRRTRAGMGRCQSGFCSTRVVDILSRELKISPIEVTKFGRKSNILKGKNKQ